MAVPKVRRTKSRGTGTTNSVQNAEKRSAKAAELFDGTYDPRMCKAVIQAASGGLSETELAVHVCQVPRSTLRLWRKKHPEFDKAMVLASDVSKSWWEERARRGLRQTPFQAHLWQKVMSSRYRDDYSERVELGGDADRPIVHRIVREIIRAKS